MTTITLTDEQEAIISEQINSGAYKSADEVIAASLNLLKEQEKKNGSGEKLCATLRTSNKDCL
ncbi:MAG TPA: type II toxin-antitoxin system ParD family antitoxin [Pyrinomonadaceae bacterium]|jgi:putative addiction module CopG family antidote